MIFFKRRSLVHLNYKSVIKFWFKSPLFKHGTMWYTFTYSWFSWFAAVKFHKVTAPLNEQILEHCSQGKYQVRFLWASGHYIFINQLIRNLVYICFCSPYLIHVVDLLTMSSRSTTLTQAYWSFSNTCIDTFLPKAHHSPLVLRNTEWYFSAMLRGHFKQQNHHREAHKCGKCGTE